MSAHILEGRAYAATIRQELASLATERRAHLGYQPILAIVSMSSSDGSPSASDVYTRQLQRAARQVGITSHIDNLPIDSGVDALHARLEDLAKDQQVHGIIVQLPLPPHIPRDALLHAIPPEKDVDGISAINAGNLFMNLPAKVPATCAAVMEILNRASIPLDGQRAVVVGASAVVGKPLALMLLQRHATVSICHIYTTDLPAFTLQADVLIVAAGKQGLITADMVRPGAVVIDVGINVLPDGNVVGDVDFAGVSEIAGAITPVPGGVGPLTNLMVLRQTLQSSEKLIDTTH
jgi:methylenetetrahydrofolate dehydrogenase (NADP+) / methenyltetrahydrofolate cyclohydrolase